MKVKKHLHRKSSLYSQLYHHKYKNRTLRFILIVCILCLPVLTLQANAISSPASSPDIPEAEQVINYYAAAYDTNYSIVDSKILKSLSGGDDAYTLFMLEPYGYAILLAESNTLMEACYVAGTATPIDITSSETVYYGGPTEYYTKIGNTFYHILSGHSIKETELDSVCSAEASIRSSTLNRSTRTSNLSTYSTTSSRKFSFVQYSYFSALSSFGTNTNNTCAVLATAILLGFYDFHICDSYVASVYEDGLGTTQSFHHLLNEYVYGTATPSDGSTTLTAMDSYITNYLTDRNLNVCFTGKRIQGTVANMTLEIIEELESWHPVVGGMLAANGAPANHAVVIYAVTYDTSDPSGTAVYTAHMGLHTEDASYETLLNSEWFTSYGSIECLLGTSHIAASGWTYYSSLLCKAYCACGYTLSQVHDPDSEGYCIYCHQQVE